MDIKFNGQAGQDLFVYNCLIKNNPDYKGTYLEIGAGPAINCNNSYLLETLGWSGLSMDISNHNADSHAFRKNPFIAADATQMDWDNLRTDFPFLKNTIDYLSLDIDEATLPCLRRFPFDKYKFKIMTVEHDSYLVGNEIRDEIRLILMTNGYSILCKDVKLLCPNGDVATFEDWWINPSLIDENSVSKYQADNEFWSDIVFRS